MVYCTGAGGAMGCGNRIPRALPLPLLLCGTGGGLRSISTGLEQKSQEHGLNIIIFAVAGNINIAIVLHSMNL